MSFGCNMPTRGVQASPENIRNVAIRAEELGFDHLWVSDHVVIPNQVSSLYPYSPTGISPFQPDQPYCEPISSLNYIAGCTNHIKLGTHVLILPYREPIVTAKAISTLDYMSGGRVILGTGVGWMEEEFKALGLDTFNQRGSVTNEQIRVFKELWTSEAPSFNGQFYSFSDISFEPKPVQKPHPPIWVGGHSKSAIRRAAKLGDGWMPIGQRPPATLDPEELSGLVIELRKLTEEAGRHANAVDVVFSSNIVFDPPNETSGRILAGSPDKVAADLRMYQEIGVQHFILSFQGIETNEVLQNMERFIAEVRPQLS